MTKRIVGFFASSLICVACSIPALAEEKGGIIARIDPDASSLTFTDGTTYRLPRRFDYGAVAPGMEAYVILGPA